MCVFSKIFYIFIVITFALTWSKRKLRRFKSDKLRTQWERRQIHRQLPCSKLTHTRFAICRADLRDYTQANQESYLQRHIPSIFLLIQRWSFGFWQYNSQINTFLDDKMLYHRRRMNQCIEPDPFHTHTHTQCKVVLIRHPAHGSILIV